MTKKVKSSVRLALTDKMRDAFNTIRSTRYPFMKEDEILKLAFSKLYAAEYVPTSMQTNVTTILAKIRAKYPDFGKKWMAKKGIEEENMGVDQLCEMLNSFIENSVFTESV
jgi:hypothetical protein